MLFDGPPDYGVRLTIFNVNPCDIVAWSYSTPNKTVLYDGHIRVDIDVLIIVCILLSD